MSNTLYLWYILNVVKIQIQQLQPGHNQTTHQMEGLPGKEGYLPDGEGLPDEAAEGLRQRVETVSLHNEDLELHQSLNVLCQVLQMVTGQMEEHL